MKDDGFLMNLISEGKRRGDDFADSALIDEGLYAWN